MDKFPSCIRFIAVVFLLLTSCSQNSTGLNIGDYEVVGTIPNEAQINEYLAEDESIIKPNVEGRSVRCTHQFLSAEQGLGNKVYVVADCMESEDESDQIPATGLANLPVLLELDPNDLTQIIGSQIPGDGSLNRSDIERIFPKSVWE